MSPTDLDAKTRALLALHLVPGIGPRLTHALLERFGTAEAIWLAQPSELAEVPRLGEKLGARLREALRSDAVDRELELLRKHDVEVTSLKGEGYPKALAAIPDAPHVLYVKGCLTPADDTAMAVVGSRHCTSYGRRMTERLVRGLVQAGFTIVSGLARGIDGVAHQTALEAGGRTVAVLAGGLSRIYPPEHLELANKIAEAGALVTETPMALEPLPQMFPARNRLISGLSRAVIVVEAALKSGALLTAQHALEQGREVMAVPGPADSDASGGTLQLIKDGAVLVRNVDDVLEAIQEVRPLTIRGQSGAASTPQPAPPPVQLAPDQQRIWDMLAGEPLHADELVQRSGLTVTAMGTMLITLELRGLIRRLPGNRFERKQ